MDYNSTYEQEIDLKDLMFAVLHKWKIILAVAIVLAVLLGGAKGAMTYVNESDPEVIQEEKEAYQDSLDTYEKNKATCEREIENLKTDIANQAEYLEKSIWINMSPYDVCEARLDLYVTTGYEIMPGMDYQNIDYTDTILQAYQALVTSNAFMEELAKKAGTEPRYLSELVTVQVGTNSGKLNHMLTITVANTTKDKASRILDQIKLHMQEMQEQVTASIGEHTVNIINESVSARVDLTLADKQREQNNRLTTLNDSLETKQKELADMEEPEETTSSHMAAVKDGIKYALLGGILGGFLVVFVICVVFLMSDKVYSAKELKDRYKVRILGKLPVIRKKKTGAIDSWLNRLEGRASGIVGEQEYSLVAANVKNYAEGKKKLLVTGSAGEATVQKAAEELSSRLSEFEIVFGGSMLQEVETVRKLPECDGVILVEECGVTKYGAVEMEIERAGDLQKEIVGCVIFE